MKHFDCLRIVGSLFSILSIIVVIGYAAPASAMSIGVDELDDILLQTGMPQGRISSMDDLTKRFIVMDLQEQNVAEPFRYVDVLEQSASPNVCATEVLAGISFSATAFRSGNQVSVYPTYEFTDYVQPRGRDSFSIALGDAVSTYEFGEKIWYKDPWSSQWKDGQTSLVTNQQGLNYAEFSGNQLGNSTGPLKYRGNVYIHATVTGRSGKRIVVNYLYNPNKVGYSVSFSYAGAGISVSVPSGTAYSKGQTIILNF